MFTIETNPRSCCSLSLTTDFRTGRAGKELFATPKGEQLVDEIVEISRQRQDEWLEPLTPAERKTFFELARKIADGPKLLTTEIMRM